MTQKTPAAQLLPLVCEWYVTEREREGWEAFAAAVPQEDMDAVLGLLRAQATGEPAPDTLAQWLDRYHHSRRERAELLGDLERSFPSLRGACQALRASMEQAGEPLSAEAVAAATADEDSFAAYLCTLSVAQLEACKERLRADPGMPADAAKSLLRLFERVQEEAFAREKEWMEKVGPLALGVATAVKLKQQIADLESLMTAPPKGR